MQALTGCPVDKLTDKFVNFLSFIHFDLNLINSNVLPTYLLTRQLVNPKICQWVVLGACMLVPCYFRMDEMFCSRWQM